MMKEYARWFPAKYKGNFSLIDCFGLAYRPNAALANDNGTLLLAYKMQYKVRRFFRTIAVGEYAYHR